MFSDLNEPNVQPFWVQTTLPPDYIYGELITLSFKMKTGFQLAVGDGSQLIPDEITLNYEREFLMIHIISPEKKIIGQVYSHVDPSKPPEVLPLGKPYELVTDSNTLWAFVPVKNWGTNYYINDNLTESVRGGVAVLRNTQSGRFSKVRQYLMCSIPAT